MKIQQLRKQRGLSFAELSKLCGLSISYLNEIEKGKKYPKDDKLEPLASALGVKRDELTSKEVSKKMEPLSDLLRSNFLSDIPLEMFGIDISKVIEIIANAPLEVSAFITALIDISRKYELQEESFYFAALRAYQRLFDNYFEDLEEAVDLFKVDFQIEKAEMPTMRGLSEILRHHYKYKIDKSTLGFHAELRSLRSVSLPEKKRLLLNAELSEIQEKFVLGKELAYKYLKIKDRVNTSNLVQAHRFVEALNNFRTSYFSVALLLPKDKLVKDMAEFFNQPNWDESGLLGIMQSYHASPEMFFQRLTNILPKAFGLNDLFFLRFNHQPGTERYTLTKELHLSRQQQPYGNEMNEHYCRRWVTIWLLKTLYAQQRLGDFPQVVVGIQKSRYIGTDDEYLVITLARSGHPTPNTNVSVSIGVAINDKLKSLVKWLDDPNIPFKMVNKTCERCPSTECQERVASPIIIEQLRRQQKIKEVLREIS